jgi:hypothetical protein
VTDSITEADRFVALCADVVYGSRTETWLAEFNSDSVGDTRVIRLTGSKPGRSALIEWNEECGFKVEVKKPDSLYYESVSTADEAFARVLLLSLD